MGMAVTGIILMMARWLPVCRHSWRYWREGIMKYVCKYAPVEILSGFDLDYELINQAVENFELADRVIHSNVCSFSRALIESRLKNGEEPLILTSCCDSIERTADVLREQGQRVFMLNLPHNNDRSAKLIYQAELLKFIDEVSRFTGRQFNPEKFCTAFRAQEKTDGPCISVMGARLSAELLEFIKRESPLPVKNNSCTGPRYLPEPPVGENMTGSIEKLTDWYAGVLLSQTPCRRMNDIGPRRGLIDGPDLQGIIYNTVSFCDFYGFEYARIKETLQIPVLKIESDYTTAGSGQMKTRLQAFFENMVRAKSEAGGTAVNTGDSESKNSISQTGTAAVTKGYYAGIDSGSTSTNVVIIDNNRNIISTAVIPTGPRVAESAQRALEEALHKGGIQRKQINNIVSTGYGRARIDFRSRDLTEITCHARGACFLNPGVRTVIDIGGQDSKVIRLDEAGNVVNFAMNDKCAAGTGRFIEMMARSLELTLGKMSSYGLEWDEEITISSMCTVFAQSEVVSLIAEGKEVEDIVHGLNRSVASRVIALGRRIGLEEKIMMSGGVAKNTGVVQALEKKLGTKITISAQPDICGALGAALIAGDAAK